MRIFSVFLIFISLTFFSTLSAQIMEEGFENNGSLPTGWQTEWEGGSVVQFNWTCYYGGYEVPAAPHSGDFNAFLRNDAGSFQAGKVRLTPPSLDLTPYENSSVALSFWQTNTNDGSIMWNELKVYSKTSESGAWSEILLIDNENSIWQKRTIVLPKPYTDDYWISFVGEETKSRGVCIDDVEVFEYFYPPQNLAISSSDAQVDLSWETPENISSSLNEYKIFRNREEIATVSGTELSYTDNSVINHQAYEYCVTAIYEDGESFASNEVFDSPLGVILPYFEGFENNGDKPFGWSEMFELNEQPWAYQSGGRDGHPSSAYDGDYNAILSKYSSWTGRKTRLVSPKLNLSAYPDATLTFFLANVEDYAGDPDILRVWYKNSESAEWEMIQEFESENVDWTEKTIVLPNTTDTYWIALEGYAYLGYGVCVDNFFINSSSIQTYSVTINVDDESANPVNDAEVTLNGYGVQNTANGSVFFADVYETQAPGIEFTVSKEGYNEFQDNVVVDEDEIVDITLIEQPLFESAVTSEDGFAIEVTFDKEMADPSGEPLTSFYYETSKYLYDIVSLELKDGDNYTIILNLDVAITNNEDVFMGYAQGTILSANGGILQDFGLESVENNVTTGVNSINQIVSIYPNPSNGVVVIENISSFNVISKIEISNISGQIVEKISNTNSVRKIDLDLSKQPKGIYFLTIVADSQVYVEKILIQ